MTLTEEELSFPPLMYGEVARDNAMDHAVLRAAGGCDAGLVAHRIAGGHLSAAMVFAPDVTLAEAVVMLPLCGVGYQNALGALAPPEVAVHLDWDGGLRVNGASCGRMRIRASDSDPDAVPDWLVIGLEVPLLPDSDAPGLTPDRTSLMAEGCADVSPPLLVEAWARHSLHWITRWEGEGTRGLHGEWRGLAHGVGEDTEQGGLSGTYLGVDERFGMLLRDGDGETHLIPITTLLEDS